MEGLQIHNAVRFGVIRSIDETWLGGHFASYQIRLRPADLRPSKLPMNTPNKNALPQEVTREDLERGIAQVGEGGGDAAAGIFGPESVSWRINREAALFLGAGRAALLQLAHPWVTAALAQHSSLLNDPIARFHNTFRVVFTMVFGSRAQAVAASRSLHQLHTRIRGRLPSTVAGYSGGSEYEANYVPALRWVFATLVESAVLAYKVVLPELSEEECAQYYTESKTLAALFGIPRAALPGDWGGLRAYVAAMCDSQELGVDVRARSMAQAVMRGAGSWVKPPRWYRALTAEWMPERVRSEFGMELSDGEIRAVARARRWLPNVYRRLPAVVRFVGPYQEARDRLKQRDAGLVARASNRFWIGQTRMPHGEVD